MDKPFILGVLATPSSDYLKAQVLNRIEGLTLDLNRMRLPPGGTEEAFAKAKRSSDGINGTAAPAVSSPKRVTAPRADVIALPSAQPVEIKPLAAAIQFENVAPTATPAAATLETVTAKPPDVMVGIEICLDGEPHVDILRAAALLGCARSSAYRFASTRAWSHQKQAGAKTVYYLKADVLRTAPAAAA